MGTLLFVSSNTALLSSLVILLLIVLLLGFIIKRFNQPYFVAYIIAGIILGPYVFKIFNNPNTIATVGELGLIIQMFFIGTKMEIQTFANNIRKPLIGVLAQLFLSFVFIAVIGILYSWSVKEFLLFTFIISLSSSAIILDYLEKNNEVSQPLGLLTSGILVLQDFLLAPMLLTINFLGSKKLNPYTILSLITSLILITFLLTKIVRKERISLPFPATLTNDHELQVFVALLFCFGFAWLTQLINLSAAIGALIAGILISQSNSMKWLDRHLMPFRVFFLSLFFVSIGLQINVAFVIRHLPLVLLLVAVILIINSAINAIVFRLLKESWRNSIYAGALLSQIGEFSLVLCMVARSQQMVIEFWYQLTLAVVSATMLITAIWINIIRKYIYLPCKK
ncbi:cation:proton antiporter domain-containing protein [Flavitalea sp.]|nr:cation:proton antiporter [Flavitalea sp.]